MSFVERSIILCPYLGGSTIGGFTVYSCSIYCTDDNILYHILSNRIDELSGHHG